MRSNTIRILLGGVMFWTTACGSTAERPGASAENAAAPSASTSSATSSSTAPEAASSPNAKPDGAAAQSPAADVWRDLTIPAGTKLALVLDTPVASDTSRVEEQVQAHLARPVTIDGVTAVPEDSAVTGVVTDATR